MNYQLWTGTAKWPFGGSFHAGQDFYRPFVIIGLLLAQIAISLYDLFVSLSILTFEVRKAFLETE
jgi:hypothetical protein